MQRKMDFFHLGVKRRSKLTFYKQGYVVRRICIICRIIFSAYFTVLEKIGPYYVIAKFASFANLWPFKAISAFKTAFQRPSNALYSMLITYDLLKKNSELFGWYWGESSPSWVKNRHSQNCLKIRTNYIRGGYLGKSQNMLHFAWKVEILTRHFIKLDPT